ncbi:hypothetical protein AB6A40_001649 [Gnathostoma spinigerum]|uniref:Acyltransferase 3 domain-containing protein n=1 Tax=Gnathostoma spinigerum TaxID=75299 RepID=A0ABD6EF32_9BILA
MTPFLLLLTTAVYISLASVRKDISPTMVADFLGTIRDFNLSLSCVRSIESIPIVLPVNGSTNAQDFFYSSYGIGNSVALITDDRFQNRMFKCMKASGDSPTVRSEYPLLYCYGYSDLQRSSKAYSICVPSTCKHDHIKVLNAWKNYLTTSESMENDMKTTVCTQSQHEAPWYTRTIPIVSLIYILTSLLIVCLATIYHIQRGDHKGTVAEKLVIAFSAKKNVQKLLEMPKSASATITCMFGIRSLTMAWIVVGHTFAWIHPYLQNASEYNADLAGSFFGQWITNFLLTVDTFFVLGGTVNAYCWFNRVDVMEHKPSFTSIIYWLKFYRHRVVRLWPAYIYTFFGVMLLSSTHYHEMPPEIDPLTQCSIHWWENLLLIGSFFDHRCMGWLWYISTEFVMYLLSPIFLLSLLYSASFGIALSVFTIITSAVLRGVAMIVYDIPVTQLGWNTPPIFSGNFIEHFTVMYTKPQYRIGPYLIGILLGYFLSKQRATKSGLSRNIRTVGWVGSSVLGTFALYGIFPILQGWNWPIYYLLYGAVHRTAWAIALAWLIYACHTGVAGFINTFLSFRVFLPLSSLCYAVYLSHMPVIFGTYLQLPFPYEYTSRLPILGRSVMEWFLSYYLGLQCSLLSELPAINIERCLLGHKNVEDSVEYRNKRIRVETDSKVFENLELSTCDKC